MIGPSSSAADLIDHLRSLRSEETIAGMGRFGIETDTALGISNAELWKIAKRVKRNHLRALGLWESNLREAQILAAFTEEPQKISLDQARAQVAAFKSWEMVDTWADIFADAGLGPILIPEFAGDEREFVRRTAFAMIAWSAVDLKTEPDETFFALLPLIETHSADPRNFVRKAVNWALRNIGKRNRTCHAPALALSERLASSTDTTARWIGKDAVKEFTSEKTLARLK